MTAGGKHLAAVVIDGSGEEEESSLAINVDVLKRYALCEEICIQCTLAIDQFDAAVALVGDEETRQLRAVWAHLHAFFTHAAMVSKMLATPSKDASARERCAYLRGLLKVEEASPVFARNARNNVEHQDERLDLWIAQDGAALLETVFANRSGYDFMTADRGDGRPRKLIRRALMMEEMIFVSEGRDGPEETELLPIVDELKRIATKAEQEMASNRQVHIIK